MSSPGQASSRAKISSARSHGEAFPAYTEFHPRWYRPRVSTYWWLKRGSYFAFILRELSSVFVAWSVVFLLLLIGAARDGGEEYQEFLAFARHPVVVGVNVVSLFFVAFHA